MSEATITSARQLKLFHLENPLSARLGNEFFRALPVSPGVYFFYDSEGQLLYIGQSNNLRARIGSYRHVTPEKNPKRSLRLVSRIIRIEWEICETAEEAIKRESVLLLEHHPPFNRAGVWKGDPWWLKAEASDGVLHLELKREEDGFGPLPSAFRFIYGSLVRCLYRLNFPELCVSKYPHGIMDIRVPLELSLALPTSKLRLRASGSDAGHNGLKDIQLTLGTDAYPKLRFGIGNNFAKGQQVDFVLGKWAQDERKLIDLKIQKCVEVIESFAAVGLARTMTIANGLDLKVE